MSVLTLEVDTIDRTQVLKTLGYGASSPPGEFILDRLDEVIANVPSTLRAMFKSTGITGQIGGLTQTEHGVIASPAFGDLSQSADTAVFCMVTAGSDMDDLIGQYDDTLDALIIDAVGSVLVEQGVDILREELAKHLGKYISLPFSPGYCDYPLAEQRFLFDVLDPSPLRVCIHPGSFMMTPIKTISCVCAAGDDPLETNPCAYCKLESCQMKRMTS